MSSQEAPQYSCDQELSEMPNVYYHKWGRDAGFSPGEFFIMWFDAQERYGHEPYHGFGHAVEAFVNVMKLADELESQGNMVNRRVLIGASLFHDTRHDDEGYKLKGYISKEAHSAAIFADNAVSYGYKPLETQEVVSVILATALNGQPHSAEDVVMIAGDIGNVGGDYTTTFGRGTGLMLLEERQKAEAHDEIFDAAKHEDESMRVLCVLAAKLINNKYVDVTTFTRSVVSNLERRASEISAKRHLKTGAYLMSLGSQAVTEVLARLTNN